MTRPRSPGPSPAPSSCLYTHDAHTRVLGSPASRLEQKGRFTARESGCASRTSNCTTPTPTTTQHGDLRKMHSRASLSAKTFEQGRNHLPDRYDWLPASGLAHLTHGHVSKSPTHPRSCFLLLTTAGVLPTVGGPALSQCRPPRRGPTRGGEVALAASPSGGHATVGGNGTSSGWKG